MAGPESDARGGSISSRIARYRIAVLCVCGAILGGTALAHAGGSPNGVVQVTIGEYVVALDPSSIHARTVTFVVTNTGLKSHEFVVLRSRVNAAHLPVDGNEVKEDSSAARNVGEIGKIAPGATKRLSLRLKPGLYVAICNYPGHFHHGMHANLRIR
jgi:uncharacterized cupredoxin-like copper-binding protein